MVRSVVWRNKTSLCNSWALVSSNALTKTLFLLFELEKLSNHLLKGAQLFLTATNTKYTTNTAAPGPFLIEVL